MVRWVGRLGLRRSVLGLQQLGQQISGRFLTFRFQLSAASSSNLLPILLSLFSIRLSLLQLMLS